MATPGRVQAPDLNFNPTIQPGPLVNAVMVQPFNPSGAGSNLMRIADSLQTLGAPMSQFARVMNANQIDEQSKQIDATVARIQAGFGTQATAEDINNVTSALHPKVAQRVTEDYMFNVGNQWVQTQLENIPHDVVMSPAEEQAFYQKLRQDALREAGNDPLRAAGFMKAVQGQIEQSSQQTSAMRRAEWTKVQTDAFGNGIAMEADKVANMSLVPQLSTAITNTAQAYNAPWLIPFLTRSAQIESSGGRNVANPNSSARGPFQFTAGTGKAYGLMSEADRLDIGKSTAAAAQFAMDNYNTLKKGLGREPTMGELYLAHQQGAGGALNLLKDPNAKATDVVGVDAVRLNGGAPGMTAGEFANLWTAKFGDSAGATPEASAGQPILPPEALALRSYFFGADAEYKATGSLANAERRDIAAQTFLQKAIQYRDERFLLAMPEELMTPAIREDYFKAREQISNLKVSDRVDRDRLQESMDKQTTRDVMYEVINRRASGEQIDPYQIAIGPDGKLDPVRYEAAKAAVFAGGNLYSDVQSKREAARLRDGIQNAFLKGDYSAIPMLTYNGDAPTADDLRTAIMMNPALNDQEKIALYGTVEKDLGTVAFLQSPPVEKWYDTNVSSTLEGMLRDPIISVKLSQFPDIRDKVREAYDLSLITQIEAAGSVPVDMRSMLREATNDAREVITNLTGATSASVPTAPTQSTDAMGNSTGTGLDAETQALLDKYNK